MIDQLDRTNNGPPKRDCQSRSQGLDLPTTIRSQDQRVSLFMLGRKKGSGSSNATNGTDYITSLITGHLPSAAPGHSIELGLDPTRDLLSLIFDETQQH